MTPIERLPGAAAFAVVVPQIDAPRIGRRGCATAAKRQGHALSEAKREADASPSPAGQAMSTKPTRALAD